jgi:hypothetical protein
MAHAVSHWQYRGLECAFHALDLRLAARATISCGFNYLIILTEHRTYYRPNNKPSIDQYMRQTSCC